MKIHIIDRRKAVFSILKGFTALVIVAFFIAAGFSSNSVEDQVKQDNSLYVVTRHSPSVYFIDQHGPSGFEYALTKSFADYLGVELKIRPVESINDIYQAIERNSANFAAAGLTQVEQFSNKVRYSEPLMEVTQQLIYKTDKPSDLSDLVNFNILVAEGSAHEILLQELQQQFPDLTWRSENINPFEMMNLVKDGEVDLAILDSIEFEANEAFFPGLKVAFDLTDPMPISWVFPTNSDTSLLTAANDFIKMKEEDGSLLQLKERYFGNINQLNYVGVQLFRRHMKNRLKPYYLEEFKIAGEKTQTDWRLLAAIGYQESHWRKRAVSPTGVKGLMMLTLPTAKEMGVTNRLDPKQSIHGGSRYFIKVHKKIPDRIQEPDRTWMALAAYNVGFGHLEDARIITQQFQKNPDDWLDVKEHLPLLQKKAYYQYTKHGFARGNEPVVYVENIRRYYDLLRWHFPEPGETLDFIEDPELIPNPLIDLPLAL